MSYLWPVEECTHPIEYRVPGQDLRDGGGQLVRRVPEHCAACGYTIAAPPAAPAGE